MTTPMMREAIEALYPPRSSARRRIRRSSSSRSSSFVAASSVINDKSSDVVTDNSLPTSSSYYGTSLSEQRKTSKSHFSELLLEHGEKDLLKDWAVCASSTTNTTPSSLAVGGSSISNNNNNNNNNNNVSGGSSAQMKQIEGRLRLCSQSIVFEPTHQTSRGIIRIQFRYMTYLGDTVTGGISGGGGVTHDHSAYNSRSIIHGNNANGSRHGSVVIRCDRHIIMKANNMIGPFNYIQTPVEFSFQFIHSTPNQFLSFANKLLEVKASNNKTTSVSFAPSVAFESSITPTITQLPSSSSSSSSNNSNSRDDIVEQIIGPTQLFDTANFRHVSEHSLTPNLQCSIKTLLLEHRGSAVLTEYGLYFQPLVASGMTNDASDGREGATGGRVLTNGNTRLWSIDDMRAIARRYDGMKDRALEIYSTNQNSILLAFESTLVREQVIQLLTQQISTKKPVPLPCYTDRSFVESALELWQADELDNYEYLLCLNAAAGRSYHDLSRYFVFPWILTNYGSINEDDDDDESYGNHSSPPEELDFTNPSIFRDLSRPVGALSDSKFEYFRKRYEGMILQQKNQAAQYNQDAPFMYGTHYSAPGYVLHYLLRVLPEHMLCLQNGKFDVPDRLFHSIDATYKSVLNNPADVKELIPEFYDQDCFDFLINSKGLQLGTLQNGERVNDVILPSWAKSAKSFLRQNRAALESDYCTRHLPKWIDLIFGVSSRGSGAKTAKNLFHPMAYLGPQEVDAIPSPERRAQAELQSTEFGIVPDQLFHKIHPNKNDIIGSWGDTYSLLTRDRREIGTHHPESNGNNHLMFS